MESIDLPPYAAGYCTNIHAGTDLPRLRENLVEYAARVRQLARPQTTLPIGLWVPAEAANELVNQPAEIERLRELIAELGLEPYTFNGFPYGNFHQKVVKLDVYRPTWMQAERLQYTMNLVAILDGLLPQGSIGSISTLPLSWQTDDPQANQLAAENLILLAQHLEQLESRNGRRIVICLEPEPGCQLDTADDMIEFFTAFIPHPYRRYLTICHDICHSAVMNESQSEVLRQYAAHGITIGKVQVSSAIQIDWHKLSPGDRQSALDQLSQFAEDRYLHQTGRILADGRFQLEQDLPELLQHIAGSPHWPEDQRWCIHFHVPIFLQRFGYLEGTQAAIFECLQAFRQMEPEYRIPHFEIETYAWGVLPDTMRQAGLAESIASEIQWFDQHGQHE